MKQATPALAEGESLASRVVEEEPGLEEVVLAAKYSRST
jgi:hypothetical protein